MNKHHPYSKKDFIHAVDKCVATFSQGMLNSFRGLSDPLFPLSISISLSPKLGPARNWLLTTIFQHLFYH